MAHSPHQNEAEEEAQPHIRILVVDDDPEALKLVQAILSRNNYDVTVSESAEKALKLLKEEVFNCIITDAIMPEMDGFEFIRSVRGLTQHSELPLLMLTRKKHREDVKKAVDAGVTDYITKPIDEKLLLEKAKQWIDKSIKDRPVSEVTVPKPLQDGMIRVQVKVISVDENDFTIQSNARFSKKETYNFDSEIFKHLGIKGGTLELIKCEEVKDTKENAETLSYESRFSLAGLPEVDLKKIRDWTRKQTS